MSINIKDFSNNSTVRPACLTNCLGTLATPTCAPGDLSCFCRESDSVIVDVLIACLTKPAGGCPAFTVTNATAVAPEDQAAVRVDWTRKTLCGAASVGSDKKGGNATQTAPFGNGTAPSSTLTPVKPTDGKAKSAAGRNVPGGVLGLAVFGIAVVSAFAGL